MPEKVLLVLGGSSDIGLALIESTYQNYDKILLHYRTFSPALERLGLLLGARLYLLQADFTSDSDTDSLVSQIADICDTPTHIVHLPAPVFQNIKFPKTKWESFETQLQIELKSIYIVLSRFLPKMTKEINAKVLFLLTSCTVNIPPVNLSAYVTAKYALLGLMKALAAEYAQKCIQINAVSPSMLETKFLADIPHLVVDQTASRSPMGRNGNVSDVVPMLSFLLSDGANYITGQNIVVSGGSA